MKKSTLSAAIGLAMGVASLGAHATLVNGGLLAYDAGNAGNFGSAAAAGASWFSMQVGPTTTLFTGMQAGTAGGVTIGANPLGGAFSHAGAPYGGTWTSDTGSIDTGWGFFGNTGLHFTAAANPISIVSGGGNSGSTLDFSGWRVTWNGIAEINMGGGTQIVTGTKGSTTYMNGSGLATITCGDANCTAGTGWTLDYNAFVPQKDPSGFGGVYYAVHLTQAAIPVPAAVWLFGSGLVGLVGIARRKKKVSA